MFEAATHEKLAQFGRYVRLKPQPELRVVRGWIRLPEPDFAIRRERGHGAEAIERVEEQLLPAPVGSTIPLIPVHCDSSPFVCRDTQYRVKKRARSVRWIT